MFELFSSYHIHYTNTTMTPRIQAMQVEVEKALLQRLHGKQVVLRHVPYSKSEK
jgi:hypothetical protein